METLKKYSTYIILFLVAAVVVSFYFFSNNSTQKAGENGDLNGDQTNNTTTTPLTPGQDQVQNGPSEVIGKSVENRDIAAYHYGTGETELLFIGGIHGGYEWNTALLAYEMMDYLKANPGAIPQNIKVTVIPLMNPDGLYKVVGKAGPFAKADAPTSPDKTVPGRFNARNVDLNRNFDCEWSADAKWQDKSVSGGNAPFSEPESSAVKKYIETHKVTATVTWFSAAGGVFASSCKNGVAGISPETRTITKKYADASGYPPYDGYDFYAITGDMVNWFAKNNIPSISVLLTNHTDTEWDKNKAGIEAILKHYAK